MDMNFNGKLQGNFFYSCDEPFGPCFIPWVTGNHFIPALGTSLMKYSPTWQPIHSAPVNVQPKQWV